ncbi:MAG TPA: 4Fe-4S double cluster binding domain-containing protein, partial [Gaiellaceae bacterium]
GPIPEDYRSELGSQVYGCDICQDVCPWNRGVEKRRRKAALDADPHVSLSDWLRADGRELTRRYERLYVPGKDARYLRRNALVALGNTGDPGDLALAETFLEDDDELVREHAEWAVERIKERHAS